jgi:hypothetical protein
MEHRCVLIGRRMSQPRITCVGTDSEWKRASRSGNHSCNWLLFRREIGMNSVKRALTWLVGIPLPFILLIALYLHPG